MRSVCNLNLLMSPPFMAPPTPPDSTRFSRERVLQGYRPGFGMRAGHWLQPTPILPSLRFPTPLFVTTLRLRLDLPHPCLATYAACSCGHPLDPLGTHLLRCACKGERTSSHDFVRNALYHIIISTHIGSALASFLHRLLGVAEGV